MYFFDCILSSLMLPQCFDLSPWCHQILRGGGGGGGTALPCLQHLWETLNIVYNILLIYVSGYMFCYLHNQWSKQTNLANLQFHLNYVLLSKNWCRKMLKKETWIWKYIYYIISLKYQLIGHPENFKIKLYIIFKKD